MPVFLLHNYTHYTNLCARHSGLKPQQYRYFDPKTVGFDFTGCMEDLAVSGTVLMMILLAMGMASMNIIMMIIVSLNCTEF